MTNGKRKSRTAYQSGDGSLDRFSRSEKRALKTTFQSRAPLADPTLAETISGSDFAYIRTRNRLAAFDAVRNEFARSGMTQKELAGKLGNVDRGRLSKILGAPGNWTLDTVAELLWAISGARVLYTLDYPLNKARRNDTKPAFAERQLPFSATIDVTAHSVERPRERSLVL